MSLIRSYPIQFCGVPWHVQARVTSDLIRIYALFEDSDPTRTGKTFVDYGDAHPTPGDVKEEITALSALTPGERAEVFAAVRASAAVRALSPVSP